MDPERKNKEDDKIASFEAYEKQIRDNFAEEGIELLLPIAPDFFMNSDSDNESPPTHLHDTPSEEFPLDLASLRERYKQDLDIMDSSSLNHHSQRNLHANRTLFDQLLHHPASPHSSGVRYVDVRDTAYSDFLTTHVTNGGQPAIIQGVVEQGAWRAQTRWDTDQLMQHYGPVPLRVMEKRAHHGMGSPYIVRIPLALFIEYSHNNTVDDPFYAFEPDFSEKRASFLEDYCVPDYFKDDLYNLNDQTRQFYPNYRHLIIGGERTGTNLHVDPKCTGAWNTLLVGCKKWAIFPPGTKPEYLEKLGTTPYAKTPATYWWMDIAPHLDKQVGMIECIQRAGETIFVPSGWWHCVLNLNFTVAITENLLIPETLPRVWRDLNTGWERFTDYLKDTFPEVVGDIPVTANNVEENGVLYTSSLSY